MTRKEARFARSGKGVKDWRNCSRFLEGISRVVSNRFEMFLDEHSSYRGTCLFCEGSSFQIPPKITIQFWLAERYGTFSREDDTKILTFMHRLSSWRTNLGFVQTSTGPFRLVFEIKVKNYAPFLDRQTDMDLFSVIGGHGSLPDASYYIHPPMPWEPPYYPPKDREPMLDLGSPLDGSRLFPNTSRRSSKNYLKGTIWIDGESPIVVPSESEAWQTVPPDDLIVMRREMALMQSEFSLEDKRGEADVSREEPPASRKDLLM